MNSVLVRRSFLRGVGAVGTTLLSEACASSDDSSNVSTPPSVFVHGVASGDPLPDAVILWTRVSTEDGTPTAVRWQLSTSPQFASIAREGTFDTSSERDFTVKVDATGLEPGTTYYYRFDALGEQSPVGRTRTAPQGVTPRLRFAVCSCASYAHGYFHSYRALAQKPDLDAVVFLGDYIYEYGNGQYGNVREYDPPHEILTIDDYRRRYAHYRRDADLQEVHRQHPFLAIWDDHEFANNAFSAGAENHTEGTEGSFAERKAVAAKVYQEWMPLREQAGGRIFRKLSYGDLADLLLLDTRIWGRVEQLEKNSSAPAIDDPERTILGDAQEDWLATELAESKAQYKIVAQQLMMGQFKTFFNGDAWDGYPASRTRFFDIIENGAIDNVLVLTGDIHSSFCGELTRDPAAMTYDPESGAGALAVEFVAPAVTSPGLPPALANAQAGILKDNRQLKFVDMVHRGYVVLDVDTKRAQAAWFLFDDIVDPDRATETFAAAFSVASGSHHAVSDAEPAEGPTSSPTLAP